MKKTILIIALFLTTICNALTPKQIDSLVTSKIDTSFTIHPNGTDSAHVVSVVNGIVTVTSYFVKQPLLNELIKNPAFSGGIVAFILGIWRRIEKRKLRRKGLLNDKK